MYYEGTIIRPPSEADSILLQVTTGCSHNKCTFCGVYSDKPFTIKSSDRILLDLQYAAIHYKEKSTVFLCDGDALIIPQNKLLQLLESIHIYLPWISRISTYANAKSLSRKTTDDLITLRKNGLRLIHLGLESGDDETLRRIKKWGDSSEIVSQCLKAKDAGINLFLTVILGIAGAERSQIHAEATANALSKIDPGYIGALSYIPVDGTPLQRDIENNLFSIPEPIALLKELRNMLEATNLSHGYFYANHASNYLPLRIRLPRDKSKGIAMIDNAINGNIQLTPEWLRGL